MPPSRTSPRRSAPPSSDNRDLQGEETSSSTAMSSRRLRWAWPAAGVAALLAFPAGAQQDPKFYGSVHAGQNNLETWDASVNFGGGVNSVGAQLKLDRAL